MILLLPANDKDSTFVSVGSHLFSDYQTVISNLLKYYAFVTISFLVGVSFHSLVYHRFDVFETNLNEAARIKLEMEWDELKAFGQYLQSVKMHRKGIEDTIEAYNYAFEAKWLNQTLVEEEEDLEHWKEDAREKDAEAEKYKRKSTMDGISSLRNSRASVGSKIAGINLANQAKDENERSEVLMNQTSVTEARGKEQLAAAQNALTEAEKAQNATALDKGICKWASVVCSVIRSATNQTEPSNAVIQANQDIQQALQVISHAEDERAKAIQLHRDASIHATLSRAILEDARAFQNQSEIDLQQAEEERTVVENSQAAVERDREKAQQEETEIAHLEQEIQNDTERSEFLMARVATDKYREEHALQKMNQDLGLVEKRRLEWEEKIKQAIHHISRAGWEALVGSVAGLCLMVLVTTRIVATFRYQRPLRWILREPPYLAQDAVYLISHLCIFVLAMGYVGELLMNFHNQTNAAKVGITVIFCLCAAFLQVGLLHGLPALVKGGNSRQLDVGSIRALLKSTILPRSTILALVSAIEMLLVWCWLGTAAFTRVHKLNNSFVWLVVLSLSVGHAVFLRKCEHAFSSQSDCEVPSNIVINDERDFLLPSFQSSASGSQPSMHTVPFGDSNDSYTDNDYGSLSRYFQTTLPLNASMKSDLGKVRFLLELWLASLGFWIMRKDLELIRKLSPLAKDLVWGQAPLWILNICLFLILASLIVSVANVKKRGLSQGGF